MLNRRTNVLLWFAFLGGGAAWFSLLMLGYGLVEVACKTLVFGSWFGVPAITVLLVILIALTALIALAAGIVARRQYQTQGNNETAQEVASRRHFMGYVGLALNMLFLLLILATGATLLYLRPCG